MSFTKRKQTLSLYVPKNNMQSDGTNILSASDSERASKPPTKHNSARLVGGLGNFAPFHRFAHDRFSGLREEVSAKIKNRKQDRVQSRTGFLSRQTTQYMHGVLPRILGRLGTRIKKVPPQTRHSGTKLHLVRISLCLRSSCVDRKKL